MKNRALAGSCRGAFTLMELMVVVLIIGILIAIVLGVARGVTNTGRKTRTTDTIRVLELSLEDFASFKGANPAYYLADPRKDDDGAPLNPNRVFPVADARDFFGIGGTPGGANRDIINSTGLLIEQFREVSSAYENLAGSLDTDALRPYSPSKLQNSIASLRQPLLPTAFDAWGNPIRYVHPYFDGLIYGANLTDAAEPVSIENDLGLAAPGYGGNGMWVMAKIRRNAEATGAGGKPEDEADSDGGLCPGEHPYFYSPGPDGDPSTTDDNVYGSSRPTFQRD